MSRNLSTVGGVCGNGCEHGRGCAWQRDMHGQGQHVWQGGMDGRGMHSREHAWLGAWQDKRQLQRAVRIPLECILVTSVFISMIQKITWSVTKSACTLIIRNVRNPSLLLSQKCSVNVCVKINKNQS